MIINDAGTYTLKYTATDSCGKTTEVDRELNVVKIPSLFGAVWDGSESSVWTRTDDSADFVDPSPAVNNGTGSSPFDNYMPWSGMQIVEYHGVGKLVSIPKFYYKWTRGLGVNGKGMHLQISNKPQDGFLTSPAHADRGDGVGERDVVYVGRYHCGLAYTSITSTPINRVSRNTARTEIHNLGADIWQYDFAMYWTIAMLYLVEFANWNSQETIGYGCGNNSDVETAGATDTMQYHTGTNAQNRTTYGHVQYRNIEDMWGNVFDWCDGIYFNRSDVYAIKNPSNFSDTANGTRIGVRPTATGTPVAFITPPNGYEYALVASEVSNLDYTLGVCDVGIFASSGATLCVGACYEQNTRFGLFGIISTYVANSQYPVVGCRLMKLPSA